MANVTIVTVDDGFIYGIYVYDKFHSYYTGHISPDFLTTLCRVAMLTRINADYDSIVTFDDSGEEVVTFPEKLSDVKLSCL